MPGIGDHRPDRIGLGIEGGNADPVALLGRLPDVVSLGEMTAGIECHDLDRQPLGKDVMGDQLGFPAEAGREHDPAVDRRDCRAQPLAYGVAADQLDRRAWDGSDAAILKRAVCVRHLAPF